MARTLVTGAAGFIGSHMCRYLKSLGHRVFAVDYQEPQFMELESVVDDYDWQCDLRILGKTIAVMREQDAVYHFAADIGGIGYLSKHYFDVMHNNMAINANIAEAARFCWPHRLFFASSACVYPTQLQTGVIDTPSLSEDMAWTGHPDMAYGAEKLMGEELFMSLRRDYRVDVRIARFHNIYGPYGTWRGGKEKAPAAMCRKVAGAKLGRCERIDVWGSGKQVRSFCYIEDAVRLIYMLTTAPKEEGKWWMPLNIGSDEAVTINELIQMVSEIAEWPVRPVHDLRAPTGVGKRNADLTMLREKLDPNFVPTPLRDGLEILYPWIEQQVSS